MMSIVAATLAYGGINPLTNERIFSSDVVRRCLSLMASCGMYDASGEFAFTVGFPCKSGVSGVLMMVIPGRCGICSWSPRIDRLGNSIRGVLFCREMIKVFHFHIFSDLTYSVVDSIDAYNLHIHRRKNRRNFMYTSDDLMDEDRHLLMVACANGWLPLLQVCVARGVDINTIGLDGMTGLHLASIHNRVSLVKYL
uniref:glutaminase n=1 Tax=Lygus hesperus TaxID=30085 RepID=A0A0A9WBV0_LYGHE